jgi:hypothetical protein
MGEVCHNIRLACTSTYATIKNVFVLSVGGVFATNILRLTIDFEVE